MSRLLIVNDIAHNLSEQGLLGVAQSASTLGESQISIILDFLKKQDKFDVFIYGTSTLLNGIVHTVRTSCLKPVHYAYRTSYWDERKFGVMSGGVLSKTSDVFCHERVCCEDGETIKQCRDRSVNYLRDFLQLNKDIICLSHPYLCQIVSNVFLNKAGSFIGEFWHKKTSVLQMDYKFSNGSIAYNFVSAFNCSEKQNYSFVEI